MIQMTGNDLIINFNDRILITGANGFIGSRVVATLLSYGFMNLRCFVRPSSDLTSLNKIIKSFDSSGIELIKGNLLSREDCDKAAQDVSVIFHLAAGIEKTFPGSFLNSVVTTRNLLDSTLQGNNLKRFLNVSSFAVYSNWNIKRGGLLDETCEVEQQLVNRHEPYTFAKGKQDELVMEYNKKYHLPYVIIRPGAVYGPGKSDITARVGIDTFGIFLHLGGSNRIPFTYVDNCAEAIVLAGIRKGVGGEVFNIVDDNLPTSRQFIKMYKNNLGKFRSISIPYRIFYFFCFLWEKYSKWSEGQLPPAFNRRRCTAYWKGNRYSNQKLKDLLGWKPKVPYDEAMRIYFEYLKSKKTK
jgi:nucleoside-diphosphate-sugar epimerase